MTLSLALDLFPLAAAAFASLVCALLGNFLLLRRQSLMGDAISHTVLPGLVLAFLITGTRHPIPMLLGAAGAGLVTVGLIAIVRRFGGIEPGAAMGVVFSVLFALGVFLIESAELRRLDLDADCVLHGQLEALVWFEAPARGQDIAVLALLHAVPRPVATLLVLYGLSLLVVLLGFKEWRLATFDQGFAHAVGLPVRRMHLVQMVLVASATVAAFEAVGSILVIAMLTVPPATARLWTDRLGTQVWLSQVFGLGATFAGYAAATLVPGALGLPAVHAAGSIVVVGGLVFGLSVLGAPRHGLIGRWWRQRTRVIVH